MANTYVGRATILCDGTETEVTARLAADRSGALASWDGEVREPGADFWDIFQVDLGPRPQRRHPPAPPVPTRPRRPVGPHDPSGSDRMGSAPRHGHTPVSPVSG